MQGRLSEPLGRGIQFFPLAEWEREFALAAECGLDEIEFIFDYDNYQNNPLWSERGVSRIKALIKNHGVAVRHICADFFMVQPFFRTSEAKRSENVNLLKKLIFQAKLIGVGNIEIPLVDNSSVRNNDEKDILVRSLRECLPDAVKHGITLSLETDLAPDEFAFLLQSFAHPRLRANYDSGNSASLGYDCQEEIRLWGRYIANVHIKDRVKGGTTVPLGNGDADFVKLFAGLKEIGYSGSFILQAARGADGQEAATVKNYVAFVKNFLRYDG